MKYTESFFWGFLVALTTLFIEVFLEIILKDFLHFLFFSIQYQKLGFFSALISIFIIAIIEESFKLVILNKRIWFLIKNYWELFFCGFLFGCGFFSLEIILAFYNQTLFLLSFFKLFLVFLTHIILGILALFFLAKFIRNRQIKTLIFIVFFHFLVNFLILVF